MPTQTINTVLQATVSDHEAGMRSAAASTSKAADAVAGLEKGVRRLDGLTAKPDIDVAIEAAQGAVEKFGAEVKRLDGLDADVRVEADVDKARRDLANAEARLQALNGAKAEMVVEADVAKAKKDLAELEGAAKESGRDAGTGAGTMVLAGLNSVPILGAVTGIGSAIGVTLLAAIKSGMGQEATRDLFGARTGLDEATARRFGRAAGEAYGNAWGDSVASNLDTARVAMQAGLLTPDATDRDVQKVIESLSGVTTILEEDIPTTARAAGVLLRTGLVTDTDAAFDVLVRGYQRGANASDDMLDTMTEYPALFERLGLDGGEAMGLLVQGMEAGARNTDLVADALKEFQIRASVANQETEASAEGFERLGLSGEDMARRMGQGGDSARAVLEETLDALREMEDPVARNAAGVELFGTQWEDLGDSLLALDVSTAVAELGELEGAAATALDRLSSNDEAVMTGALRNISLAADGIKGALAAAVSDEATDFAAWVTRNRAPMMEFLLDVVNGIFDFAGAAVTGFADAHRAVGEFIAGPAADLIVVLGDMAFAFDDAMPGDQGGLAAREWAQGVAESMRTTGEEMVTTADGIETEWGGALDEMQRKANEWAAPEILQARMHDAALAAAERVGELETAIAEVEGTVTINGDTAEAENTLAILEAEIEEGGGFVTINGDTVTAADALDTVLQLIREGEEAVTIDGDTTEVDQAREDALANIRASAAAVGIGGDTTEGDRQRQGLLARVASSGADIKVGVARSADFFGELSGLAAIINGTRANIKVGATRTFTTAQLGPQAYHGGKLPGKQAGGLVPGDRAGYDNVLWPMATGGKTLAQPLEGGEFVVNSADTAFWEPMLEWMNAGGRPSPGGGDGGGGLTAEGLAAALAGLSIPVTVEVDGRALYTATKQADRRYGGKR